MAAVLTKVDTFAALDTCFTADLAALIGSEPPRSLSPTRFIDLVEEVRDILAESSLGNFQDASAVTALVRRGRAPSAGGAGWMEADI